LALGGGRRKKNLKIARRKSGGRLTRTEKRVQKSLGRDSLSSSIRGCPYRECEPSRGIQKREEI